MKSLMKKTHGRSKYYILIRHLKQRNEITKTRKVFLATCSLNRMLVSIFKTNPFQNHDPDSVELC